MSERKWTKGPWFADKNGNIWRRDPSELYENGGSVGGDKPLASVCRGFYHDGAVGYPVDDNARLIAAAPDLYEALFDLTEAIHGRGNKEIYQAAERARAALQRAEGEV